MAPVTTSPIAPVRPPNNRRIAGWAIASVLLLVGTIWVVFTSLYAPFGHSILGAPGENVSRVSDGLTDTAVLVTGPEGTVGVMGFGLSNTGPVPIRIEGPVVESLAFGTRPFRDAQWSPLYTPDGQPASHEFRYDPRPFPATVRAGEHIVVWISVRKYDCGGGVGTLETVPLRWSVLGRSHTYDLPLDQDHGRLPIAYCYPDSALKHVSR